MEWKVLLCVAERKHKGWFDELDALEMESLQKAFKKGPSIKEWIHDRSNDGNWWNTDVETRPVWDDQLGVGDSQTQELQMMIGSQRHHLPRVLAVII